MKFRDIIDADMVRVWFAGALPAGLTLAQVNTLINILAGIVAITFTIYKWRRKKRNFIEPDTDL